MSASEGWSRIAVVVRWLGYLAGASFLAGALAFASLALVIPGLFVTAFALVLAWIIEGFAKPKE
jgi:hypothetical protein